MTDHDPVNHPSHYTSGGIECIDAIEAALTPEEARGFRKGNAMKYIWRAGRKGNYEEDLGKADWYLERERVTAKREADNPGPEDYSGLRCYFSNKIIARSGSCDGEGHAQKCRPLMAGDGFCGPDEVVAEGGFTLRLDAQKDASVGSSDEANPDRPHRPDHHDSNRVEGFGRDIRRAFPRSEG